MSSWSFTSSQKRGALIFLAILVALLGWRWRVSQLAKEKSLPEWSAIEEAGEEEVSPEEGIRPRFSDPSPSKKGGTAKPVAVHIELNGADSASLRRVRGIGPVFAARIIKYRNAIGGFEEKSDLKQVYGVGEEEYANIAPQVWVDPKLKLPTNAKEGKTSKNAFSERPISVAEIAPPKAPVAPVNINLADSTTLVSVKGIGAKTASNIIKYRSLIYFFHTKEQLSEVWGIYPENLERMLPLVTLGEDLGAYPHLRINEADQKSLSGHKYLGRKEAGIIVAYRELHGPFVGEEDLRKVLGIKAETINKLIPYLQY